MKKLITIFIAILAYPHCSFPQVNKDVSPKEENVSSSDSDNYYDDSMVTTLLIDYFANKENRKQKRECYIRYSGLFLQTLYSQVTAPVMYVGYYLRRKQITKKIQCLYERKNLTNIENIGVDIINDVISKEELRKALGTLDYNLWLYGDTEDPAYTGGVPDDYKPSLPLFWRRWFFCGVRNPRWNATYLNFYTQPIVNISTRLDTRTDVTGSNYGTGDTRLGTVFRWYVDANDDWWFFYESTKRKNHKKGSLFYFGTVGLGEKQDGIQTEQTKKGRFEFSLNRTVHFQR